ncbi:dihydrodipicolinate synthase family protein [Candidatus Poribacteria bacterium]|nr:dihydrodipicolinate synthase family protein [Candidatus Poribacteria bacterium]MYK17822.1 dihydrodipicolinate synthase family protein [Candidatus Poribacteria bacterium]
MSIRFEGIFSPTITPLDEKERVDELGFVNQLNRLIDNGVHGIYLLGTSGEFTTLTSTERERAMDIATKAIGGRVPIICGVMDTSTQRVIENIETATQFGVDAVAATPGYYYPSTDDADLIQFYQAVAGSTELPVFIYNIPSTVKTAIKPQVVAELADACDNIVGIKDSSGDWTNCLNLLALFGDRTDFAVMLGSHTAIGAAVLFGADGGVVSISNVAPKESVALYNAAKARDIDEVHRLQKLLLQLSKMYTYGQGVSGMKACLEILGVCNAYTTSPLLPISDAAKAELRELLTELEILE